jgi:hypothetical protein
VNKYFKGLLILASTLVPISIQATAASASTVRPMSFDICGTNARSGIYNCMYVNGYSNIAYEVRGWSHATTSAVFGLAVHEEVQGPGGDAFCNSATVTLTNTSQVIGCQSSWSGPEEIAPGQYCAILWAWTYGPVGIGGSTWHYANEAENCGTVSY